MSGAQPQARIDVGIVLERHKAKSQWVDYIWRPVAALPGVPDTPPWTPLDGSPEAMRYYAGGAEVKLYRSEVPRYRENLASAAPALWVVLRPTSGEPAYEIVTVTADPSEGEAMTESGADLVETVPMPPPIQAMIEAFVAAHPVEETFFKRKRQDADPQALARRAGRPKDAKP